MRPLPFALALTLALTLAAAPLAAQTALPDAAVSTLEFQAIAMDGDRDGRIDPVELLDGAEAVFASMDVDGDRRLTLPEMTRWSEGLSDMAVHRDRLVAHDTAFGTVFALLDADGNGTLARREWIEGLSLAALLADGDGDGAMSLAEMRERFIVAVAARVALSD